jgi:hypothetical protein
MGLFDNYEHVQIKVGDPYLRQFEIGDKVPIIDGVYVGNEGVVVVKDQILVAVFDQLISKWGEAIQPSEVLDNPLDKALAKIAEEREE